MKTCVIIPTYNEAREIGGLIKEVMRHNLDVVVVDDGSNDNTPQIAGESGAFVLRNAKNQGKGASLIRGFDYALGKGYEAVITMDGDGQHLPEDLPFFIRLAKYSDSGIIIGNRMQKAKNMPLARFLTNKALSCLISGIAKQKIPDTQCGFRLIKRRVLEEVKLSTNNYETESEILLRCSRLGQRIESVPIKTVYRGQKSRINPVMDSFRFLRFILKELWTTRH